MPDLRHFTSARVDLPLAGESLATSPLLDLRLSHARARDAVHMALDLHSVSQSFAGRSWPSLVLRTAAQNRDEYLRRPDRGRQLSEDSALSLSESCASCKYAFVIADGLSALAIHRHAVPLLELVFAGLDWKPDQNCPIFIVEQGRVAIGDAIGEAIQSDLSVVFIGERPGLSSPDSLGVYLTWAPRNGRTDGERNCISNIHANGLSYAGAAHKLLFLIKEAQRRKLTGVTLKETAGQLLSMENGQRSISD